MILHHFKMCLSWLSMPIKLLIFLISLLDPEKKPFFRKFLNTVFLITKYNYFAENIKIGQL